MTEPERPLRVLHVAHALEGYAAGGVGRYVRAVARAQRELGAWVDVVGPAELGSPGRGFRAHVRGARCADALGARVRQHGADIVHVHHLSGLGFGLVDAARSAGARVVITLHDHGIGCARGQRVDRQGRACAGPDPAACADCLRPDGLPARFGRARAAERITAARALTPDLWLTVAPHLASALGVDAEPCDLPVLEAPLEPAPYAGPARFLWVGSVIPTKGPDLAVRAFARLPAGAATLDLVGPVVPYDGSTRYADALLGALPPGARHHGPGPVAPWYARADALLFPSRWDEGCPLVLREAAACGLPILAADVPGARHALGAHPTVWLPPDVGAWAAAMARAVQGLPRTVRRAGVGVHAHAEALLSRYRRLREESRSAPPCPRSPGEAAR